MSGACTIRKGRRICGATFDLVTTENESTASEQNRLLHFAQVVIWADLGFERDHHTKKRLTALEKLSVQILISVSA